MSTATENAASTAPVEIPTLGALEDQVLGQFSGLVERTLSTPSALTSQLLDQGVEARLIVYKGFGHGITKPKERLAAVWHNWQWFGKHLWGETIELPLGEGAVSASNGRGN